jgi:hypothetical protein
MNFGASEWCAGRTCDGFSNLHPMKQSDAEIFENVEAIKRLSDEAESLQPFIASTLQPSL